MGSAFDQANIAGARAFAGVFGGELDALPFAQQLKHRAPDGAAVEEVFDAALVSDEPESFVYEEACYCPGRHTEALRSGHPGYIPGLFSRKRAPSEVTLGVGTQDRLNSAQRLAEP